MSGFELTESEAQRYDRQIRVWGAEAQARIQKSKVLICGVSHMNIEVAKNIVLAGMSVTLQGSRDATYDDLSHNFFLSVDDVGKPVALATLPRVQQLNAFANVVAETTPLEKLPDSYFNSFSVILLTDCSEAQALRINRLCRERAEKATFFWSDVFGDEGLFYADFGDNFTFKEDLQPGTAATSSSGVPKVQKIKNITFPDLSTVLSKKWSTIPSRFFPLCSTFVKNRLLTRWRDGKGVSPVASGVSDLLVAMQEENGLPSDPVLSPEDIASLCRVAGSASVMACSVLGSFLSQEVVKAVSLTGEPAYNVFVFSAENFEGKALPIG
jgi:ubiquitin-like 1-activating enzyme E1 A